MTSYIYVFKDLDGLVLASIDLRVIKTSRLVKNSSYLTLKINSEIIFETYGEGLKGDSIREQYKEMVELQQSLPENLIKIESYVS